MADNSTSADHAAEGSSLAERLEQRQLVEEYRAAMAKHRRGESLKTRERQAIAKYERQQTAIFGLRYLSAMPKADFLRHFKGNAKTYLAWARDRGCPWPDVARDPVDVRDMFNWLRDQYINDGKATELQPGEDPMLSGCSQAVKDEFVRAQIADKRLVIERRKMELEREMGLFVPLEPIVDLHNELAERLKRTRERLVRQFDGDERERIERAFDDLIDDYLRQIAEKLDASDEHRGDEQLEP